MAVGLSGGEELELARFIRMAKICRYAMPWFLAGSFEALFPRREITQ